MRSHYPRTIIFALAICNFLASCSSSPGTTGVALSKQAMVADVGGAKVADVWMGGVVEYLGAVSPDSSTIKIRFEGKEGWVPMASILMNATVAVTIMKETPLSPHGSSETMMLFPVGFLLAVDSTDGQGYSRVAFSLQSGGLVKNWVLSKNLSTDPKEIAFAIGMEKMKTLPVEAQGAECVRLLAAQAGSPQVTTIKVNLSEVPDNVLASMQEKLLFYADKGAGQVTVTPFMAETRLYEFFHDFVYFKRTDYETGPRVNYFERYISQLPVFVKIGPRFEFAEDMGEEQSWKSYLLFRVDRSPENIKALWDTYGATISAMVSLQDQGRPLDNLIHRLITVHDHIFSLPDYKARCAAISRQVAEWEKKTDKFYSAVMEQRDIYDPILHAPTITKYSEATYQTEAYWLHSFWVRRMAEGNADVVYAILKELTTEIKAEGVAEAEEEAFNPGEPKTMTCTFQDVGLGDCWHVIFDCGDYGDADTSQLDAASQALWESLYIADGQSNGVANPEYVGKQFIMKVGTTRGSACNEGQGGEGDVPLLMEFKLAGN